MSVVVTVEVIVTDGISSFVKIENWVNVVVNVASVVATIRDDVTINIELVLTVVVSVTDA